MESGHHIDVVPKTGDHVKSKLLFDLEVKQLSTFSQKAAKRARRFVRQ